MTVQVTSWFGAVVPSVTSHPAVRSLAEKWLQIRTERDPCLGDFWHNADDAFVDNTILLLKGKQDYVYLHHGRALQQRIGFSMQGLPLTELRTRIQSTLRDIYDRSAAEFILSYFQSFADFQQDVVLWGRLALPVRLGPQDPSVAILLYCHPIDDKISIYRATFERSRAGIVIGAPIRNDADAIVDAWVIAQNDEARHMTGMYEHASSDLVLRSAEIFARDDIWSAVIDGVTQRATVVSLSDQTGARTINIYSELVDGYLVVRMTFVAPTNQVFLID